MKLKITLDAQTRRRYDTNGFLHVGACHIAKEMVYPYLGAELPPVFRLDGKSTYYAYLPGSVLMTAARSFEGVPLLIDHHNDNAKHPAKQYRVGSLGRVQYRAPYLDADLHVTDRQAIDLIESNKRRELSIGFYAEYARRPGAFRGVPYDFIITRLTGGHVALVKEGRAGHDCLVADSARLDFMTWISRRGLDVLTNDRKGAKSPRELAGQRKYNRSRPNDDDFYYAYEWKQARREYLKKHPTCEKCHSARAVLVDHIKPVSQGGARLAASNLQALCAKCHNRKTAAQGRR